MNHIKNKVVVFALLFNLFSIFVYGQSTVRFGKLDIIELCSNEFDNGLPRTIRIWTPENYSEENERYSVLYMQDGGNLFDAATSFAGEWRIDESLTEFEKNTKKNIIVVGIDCGSNRANEYSPNWEINKKSISSVTRTFVNKPIGDIYINFVIDTVKKYVDSNYRTLKDSEFTYIGGSSMGGIISLYGALEKSNVFGGAIVFSPALHIYKKGTVKKYIKSVCKKNNNLENLPKLYVYCGGNRNGDEAQAPWDEQSILPFAEKIQEYCLQYGWPKEKIKISTNKWRTHSESSWSAEFPNAIEWLFQ